MQCLGKTEWEEGEEYYYYYTLMVTIPAYEEQLQEEADCNEAIWCKLVTGHTTVTIGSFHFVMDHKCFAAARPMCPAYVTFVLMCAQTFA